MSDKKSNWIWLPTWTAEDKENPALVLFRKEVEITGTPIAGKITISADSRYKTICKMANWWRLARAKETGRYGMQE